MVMKNKKLFFLKRYEKAGKTKQLEKVEVLESLGINEFFFKHH